MARQTLHADLLALVRPVLVRILLGALEEHDPLGATLLGSESAIVRETRTESRSGAGAGSDPKDVCLCPQRDARPLGNVDI